MLNNCTIITFIESCKISNITVHTSRLNIEIAALLKLEKFVVNFNNCYL